MSGVAENELASSHMRHASLLEQPGKSSDDASAASNGLASNSNGSGPADGDGDQTQRKDLSRSAGSPEPNCAICLGNLENKSFTDSCFHMFCFVCLQEWSKVKAECPLCKQPFKSIIHNVRSYNVYDQFYLDATHPTAPRPYRPWDWDYNRSFRFRTTLSMDHRYMRHDGPTLRSRTRPSDAEPSLQRPSRFLFRMTRERQPYLRQQQQAVQTVDFRRRLYENGYQVTGVRSHHRYRQVSPEFFSSNPAQTHRLVPWLNRELNALLYCHVTQVQFVLELIMDLIKRFPIDSEEFYQHVYPYIGRYTRHFMHEFQTFARSPYNMMTYDAKVMYEPAANLISSSESSDDSDCLVIDDDEAPEAGRPTGEGAGGRSALLHSGIRAEPPAARLGFESTHVPPTPAGHRLHSLLGDILSPAPSSSVSGWDSPTPGPSWDLGHNTSTSPVNVVDSSDSDASTIIDTAYYPEQHLRSRRSTEGSNDGDDVIVVAYDKPWEERSPIMLSSGSDNETLSKFSKRLARHHYKNKATSSNAFREASSSKSRQRERRRSSTQPSYSRSRSLVSKKASSHHSRSRSGSSRWDKLDANSSHYRRSTSTGSDVNRMESRSYKRKWEDSDGSRSSHRAKHEKSSEHVDDLAHTYRKKHKHKKKHKKSRGKETSKRYSKHRYERECTRSRRHSGSGSSRESWDNFKKHPSGHKKSRAHSREDGSRALRKSLFSNGNVASSSTTTSTTSIFATQDIPAQLPAWNPLQSLFGNSHHVSEEFAAIMSNFNSSFNFFSHRVPDVAPTWDNIARMAGLVASSRSHSLTQGSGHDLKEPLVITSSSEESDQEESRIKNNSVNEFESSLGNKLSVAHTVVVPGGMAEKSASSFSACSSSIPSSIASTSVVITTPQGSVEEYVDVDSFSSCEKSSDSDSDVVLDVELIDEEQRPSISNKREHGQEETSVLEVSANPVDCLQTSTTQGMMIARPTITPSFTIESILSRDVFMGVDSSSRFMLQPASASGSSMHISSQAALPSPHFQPSFLHSTDPHSLLSEKRALLDSLLSVGSTDKIDVDSTPADIMSTERSPQTLDHVDHSNLASSSAEDSGVCSLASESIEQLLAKEGKSENYSVCITMQGTEQEKMKDDGDADCYIDGESNLYMQVGDSTSSFAGELGSGLVTTSTCLLSDSQCQSPDDRCMNDSSSESELPADGPYLCDTSSDRDDVTKLAAEDQTSSTELPTSDECVLEMQQNESIATISSRSEQQGFLGKDSCATRTSDVFHSRYDSSDDSMLSDNEGLVTQSWSNGENLSFHSLFNTGILSDSQTSAGLSASGESAASTEQNESAITSSSKCPLNFQMNRPSSFKMPNTVAFGIVHDSPCGSDSDSKLSDNEALVSQTSNNEGSSPFNASFDSSARADPSVDLFGESYQASGSEDDTSSYNCTDIFHQSDQLHDRYLVSSSQLEQGELEVHPATVHVSSKP